MRKPRIYEVVYKDLIKRAKDHGADMIIFNYDAFNETPKEFLNYLAEKGLKKSKIKIECNTKGYLESKNPVNGYIVNVAGKTN